MSLRRIGGRFVPNTSSEAYQRQLTAPVHKWKKTWVTPAGLQPESSYKVCKWVRINDKAVIEDEDLIDGQDEDVQVDEGDEDMEEGEEGANGAAEEKDEEGAEGAVEGKDEEGTNGTPNEKESEDKETQDPEAAENGAEAEAKDAEAKDAETMETEGKVEGAENPIQSDDTDAPEQETSAAQTAATTPFALEPDIGDAVEPPPADIEEEEADAPESPMLAENDRIPSNAVEIVNTAGDTEVGTGDLGASGEGFEMTEGPAVSTRPSAEAMDLDEAGSAGPERDEGLVMGEADVPKSMELDGPGLEQPPEVEQ